MSPLPTKRPRSAGLRGLHRGDLPALRLAAGTSGRAGDRVSAAVPYYSQVFCGAGPRPAPAGALWARPGFRRTTQWFRFGCGSAAVWGGPSAQLSPDDRMAPFLVAACRWVLLQSKVLATREDSERTKGLALGGLPFIRGCLYYYIFVALRGATIRAAVVGAGWPHPKVAALVPGADSRDPARRRESLDAARRSVAIAFGITMVMKSPGSLWGRMISCAPVANRRWPAIWLSSTGGLPTRRRLPTCPTSGRNFLAQSGHSICGEAALCHRAWRQSGGRRVCQSVRC